MKRAVVKHSYLKGQNRKVAAVKHANYIVHRPGKDKDERREIYNGTRDNISLKEVRETIKKEYPENFVVHKLILSPGMNKIDMKEYARSTMDMLSSTKGQDLIWFSVDHDNTDHRHSHVIVMGRDAEHAMVRFTKEDYVRMRLHGDKYLEREHGLDRFMDSSLEKILHSDDYRTSKEKLFDIDYRNQFLMSDEDYKRLRSDKDLRDQIDFEMYDEELKNRFRYDSSERQRITGKEINRQMAGRLTPFHERAQLNIVQERFRMAQVQNPDHSFEIAEILESLDKASEKQHLELAGKKDFELDLLLGNIEEHERIDSRSYDGKLDLEDLEKTKETPEPDLKLDDIDTSRKPLEQEKILEPILEINSTLDEIKYMESKHNELDHSEISESFEDPQVASKEFEKSSGESPITSGWYSDPSDFGEGSGINVETNTNNEREKTDDERQ